MSPTSLFLILWSLLAAVALAYPLVAIRAGRIYCKGWWASRKDEAVTFWTVTFLYWIFGLTILLVLFGGASARFVIERAIVLLLPLMGIWWLVVGLGMAMKGKYETKIGAFTRRENAFKFYIITLMLVIVPALLLFVMPFFIDPPSRRVVGGPSLSRLWIWLISEPH